MLMGINSTRYKMLFTNYVDEFDPFLDQKEHR